MFGNLFGNWLLNLAGWATGFQPGQLAFIEKRLPNLRKLIAIIAKAQPLIVKIAPLANEATPIIQQAIPLVEAAMAEVKVLAPALDIILGVIERDVAAGKSAEDAMKGIVNKLHF